MISSTAAAETLLGKLSQSGISANDIVFSGSTVLEVLGIRAAHDLDFICKPSKKTQVIRALSSIEWSRSSPKLELVQGTYESFGYSDEQIFSLLEDFTFSARGMRFARPELEFTRKSLRRMPKDIRDLDKLLDFSTSKSYKWDWCLVRTQTALPYSQHDASLSALLARVSMIALRDPARFFILVGRFFKKRLIELEVVNPLLLRMFSRRYRDGYSSQKLVESAARSQMKLGVSTESPINPVLDLSQILRGGPNDSLRRFVFPFLIWPAARPFLYEILFELGKLGCIIGVRETEPNQSLRDVVEAAYKHESVDVWKTEVKLCAMSTRECKTVTIVYVVFPTNTFRLRGKRLFSHQAKRLKATIRNRYHHLIPEYRFDEIIHSPDNFEKNALLLEELQRLELL